MFFKSRWRLCPRRNVVAGKNKTTRKRFDKRAHRLANFFKPAGGRLIRCALFRAGGLGLGAGYAEAEMVEAARRGFPTPGC
jgi:hypothetical protein